MATIQHTGSEGAKGDRYPESELHQNATANTGMGRGTTSANMNWIQGNIRHLDLGSC